MNKADLEGLLAMSRRRTMELVEAVGALAEPMGVLSWSPGVGRVSLGWQLMHIAATEDRHLHVRMLGGEPAEGEWVRRFASGSVPGEEVPGVEVIRGYLAGTREALVGHLWRLSEGELLGRPREGSPYVYGEWFQVLALHEAYHHGQGHLTWNLYRGSVDGGLGRVGH